MMNWIKNSLMECCNHILGWSLRNVRLLTIPPLNFNTHIYENGEVSIYVVSNGELDSEVDVNLKALGFDTIEQLVIDLLNNGYKFNL